MSEPIDIMSVKIDIMSVKEHAKEHPEPRYYVGYHGYYVGERVC